MNTSILREFLHLVDIVYIQACLIRIENFLSALKFLSALPTSKDSTCNTIQCYGTLLHRIVTGITGSDEISPAKLR